jgi:hypothetical protein
MWILLNNKFMDIEKMIKEELYGSPETFKFLEESIRHVKLAQKYYERFSANMTDNYYHEEIDGVNKKIHDLVGKLMDVRKFKKKPEDKNSTYNYNSDLVDKKDDEIKTEAIVNKILRMIK